MPLVVMTMDVAGLTRAEFRFFGPRMDELPSQIPALPGGPRSV